MSLKTHLKSSTAIFGKACGKKCNNHLIRLISDDTRAYNIYLISASVAGFIFLLCRTRLGIDLTDEAWHSADPYWVARGATPYVNNWTQASGFSLPLYVFFYAFLRLTGGNAGIIIFARTLYCIWKTIIIIVSFSFMKRANFKIPDGFAFALIIYQPGQVYSINYNTIGLSYLLLAFSLLANVLSDQNSSRKKFWIAFTAGIVFGRSVIGTLATVLGCVVAILFLVIKREWDGLKGMIFGGITATVTVILYCCIRGGVSYFIRGIQYFVRDQSYYDSVTSHRIPFMVTTVYLCRFMMPAIIAFGVIILMRLILIKHTDIFNKMVTVLFVIFWGISLFYLGQYDGSGESLAKMAKYGWFISPMALFIKFEEEKKKKIECFSATTIVYLCVYVFQGYVSNYGIYSRPYWNFVPLILSGTVVFMCAEEFLGKIYINKVRLIVEPVICIVVGLIIAKGAYCYVYRDLPIDLLDTKVETGVWKGCYTSKERATTVVELENVIKSITGPEDQVLCYGNWACFINLLSDGQLCAPNAIGTGQKQGFDYWYMYQKVPTKVIVNIDEEDVGGRMTSDFPLWNFIDTFYTQTYEYDYTSYYCSLEEAKVFRILEYEITDYDAALSYADKMATKIYEPGR